jgi:hypothetical protein
MTQTRKEALIELREKVKAGDHSPGSNIVCAAISANLYESFMRAHHGSLDAAKALHDAVLPGWTMDQMNEWWGSERNNSAGWAVHLLSRKLSKRVQGSGLGVSPARAWLLAILEALIAKAGDGE